jgi:secreted trypsin-like serine protease
MTTVSLLQAEDWEQFNSSLLIEVSRPNGVFTCTGVAITPQIILTAAHCLEGKILKVRVFTQSYYDPNLDALKIKSFKLHPDYRPKRSRYDADLAKIFLEDKLPDSIFIPPLFTERIIRGDLYRFGFGERKKKNLRTAVKPTLKEINYDERLIELNDRFSFSGDSGGPIYLKRDGQLYLLAIHSTLSFGPEGKYSYNPLVGPYQKWILEN